METVDLEKIIKSKNRIIICFVILFAVLLLAGYFLNQYHRNKEANMKEENVRSEERIKLKEAELTRLVPKLDSLKSDISQMNAIIEYQKNNPQIIREKYVEIRNNVVKYNVDDKIKYLTNRLSKKDHNR